MRVSRPRLVPAILLALLSTADGSASGAEFPRLDVRDFDADGGSDLVAFCPAGPPPRCAVATHEVWALAGPMVLGRAPIEPVLAPHQRLAGAADFDGDGGADLVVSWPALRATAIEIWPMRGSIRKARPTAVRAPAGVGWDVVATADVDGVNGPDVVWHNAQSGRLTVTLMASLATVGTRTPAPDRVPAPGWSLLAVQDFGNGHLTSDGRTADYDGHVDFLWLTPEGGLHLWFMDGRMRRVAERPVSGSRSLPAGTWNVAAAGDYTPGGALDGHRPGIVWWPSANYLTDPPRGGSGSIVIEAVSPEGDGDSAGAASGGEVPPGWILIGPR